MYPRYIYRSSAYLQGSQPKHTTLARLTIGCQGPKVSGRENEIEGLGGYIAIWLKWRGGGGGKGSGLCVIMLAVMSRLVIRILA